MAITKKRIKTNKVFHHLRQSQKRLVVEQGGTRSGKTFNILLYIIFDYSVKNTGKVITICRKTFPSLRASVMRDFMNILQDYDEYREELHNKSSHEYQLNGNMVEFISLDQPQKIRGRKRDLCFINEGNELSWEDFFQLNIRTEERIVIDFNPSDEYHWIYDQVVPREDCSYFKTTYLDNPFLPPELVAEIEKLKETDEVYWKVYGLGERAQARSVIFNFETIPLVPDDARLLAYGLDFGYVNDPTALVEVYQRGESLYFKERLYDTGLTNQMIAKYFDQLGLNRQTPVYADSSEPKSITEIRRWGWNIKPTQKGPDSINAGIDIMRRYKLYWTEDSSNGIKEMRNYKWKEDRNNQLMNTPVDAFNHLIDAVRYGCYMSLSNPTFGKYSIR